MHFILLSIACTQNAVQPSQDWLDQQSYLSASQQPVETALTTCTQIQNQELHGECVWFAAKKYIETTSRRPIPERMPTALKYCAQAPSEEWQQVCYFDILDGIGISGQDADKACPMTGEFAERCMIHALLREEEALSKRYPKGQEVAMMNAIQSRMDNLGLQKVSEEPIHETLTARVVARRFESSWRNNPSMTFSSDDCGELPVAICVDAYRIAIKQIGRGKLPSPCVLPMSVESVRSVGLPVWNEDLEDSVQTAWKSLCHATYGPQKAPDYASSQKAKNESRFKSPQVKTPHQPKGSPKQR